LSANRATLRGGPPGRIISSFQQESRVNFTVVDNSKGPVSGGVLAVEERKVVGFGDFLRSELQSASVFRPGKWGIIQT
jgi:hypothetical protein